jgi:hypothetical protein
MAQGRPTRKTTMFRSYRVSQRTSMGTVSPVPSGRSADDNVNFELDFCNMTFSGPGAE